MPLNGSYILHIFIQTLYLEKERNWLLIITPCRLVMLFAIFAIVDACVSLGPSGGWSGIATLLLVFFLSVITIIDLVLSLLIKKKAGLLWLIEIALTTAVAIWIFSGYF